MSQAMLMRIIALENRVDELEKLLLSYSSALRQVLDAQTMSAKPNDAVEQKMQADYEHFRRSNWDHFRLEQHGVGWWRVFGPDGEITEKGLRKHEAQALADDLNEQAVSRTA